MSNETKGKWSVNTQFTDKTEFGAVVWEDSVKPRRICCVTHVNDANLIAKAINNCKEVNESNPLVVAENIKKLVETLEDLVKASDTGMGRSAIALRIELAREVLNKISEVKE